MRNALNALGWDSHRSEVWDWLKNNPVKVAILAPPYDTVPSKDGNAVYVLAERLAEKMPFPSLILSIANGLDKTLRSPVQNQILYYSQKAPRFSLDRMLPYRLKKRFWGTTSLGDVAYARAATKALKVLEPELIIIEDTPYLCQMLRQSLPNTKIILHQHNNAILGLPQTYWRKTCQSIDRLVCVAQRNIEAIEAKHGKLQILHKVIYNGVDLEHYQPQKWQGTGEKIRQEAGIAPDELVLLFAGRIIAAKGILEVTKAFIAAQSPKAHLLIVGNMDSAIVGFDNAYSASIKELAQKSEAIHLVGNISQDELPTYYAAANLVIVPSIQPEGLPKVVTEALAMGKPVIASKEGGSWELLREGENGWLLADPQNLDETSKLFRSIFSNRPMIEAFSNSILENDRAKMSEDRMVKEFVDLIDFLLNEVKPEGMQHVFD